MELDKKLLNSRLEKWAYFFTKEGLAEEEEEMKILIKNDPVMDKAHKTYKTFTADDELLQVYEAREKRLHDEASRLSDAKEEGIREGLQKGIEQGLRKTAIKMKELGVSADIISNSTGLTEKEISEL